MRYSHWPLLEPCNLILIGHLQAGDEVGVTGNAWMKRGGSQIDNSAYIHPPCSACTSVLPMRLEAP